MVSARESIVLKAVRRPTGLAAFVQAFGEEAVTVLADADRRAVSPDARLNLVMTFAQLQRVEAVPFLCNALTKEPYPATRYWAAKGLAMAADAVAEKSLPRTESDMAEAAEKAFDMEMSPAEAAMWLLEMLGKFDHEKAHDVLADAMIKFVQHNSAGDPMAAQVMDQALAPGGSLVKAYNRETRADAKSHILMALATACVWVQPPTALANLMPDINASLEAITGEKVGFLVSDDPTMQKLALMEWAERLFRDKMIPKRPALPQAIEDAVKEMKEGGGDGSRRPRLPLRFRPRLRPRQPTSRAAGCRRTAVFNSRTVPDAQVPHTAGGGGRRDGGGGPPGFPFPRSEGRLRVDRGSRGGDARPRPHDGPAGRPRGRRPVRGPDGRRPAHAEGPARRGPRRGRSRPDDLTYAFDLRQDARWSDGRPVTSADFVYAWRRALDPATAAEYVYMLYPIRGAKAFYEAVQKLPAADGRGPRGRRRRGLVEGRRPGRGAAPAGGHPRAAVRVLPRPDGVLDVPAGPRRRHRPDESGGERWTMPPNLISNGAYRLAEWQFRSRMVWEKNPHYWDAANVALGRIEVRVFDDINTALLAYETGAVDMTTIVPAMAMEPLLEAGRDGHAQRCAVAANLGTYFYRLNCRKPPLTDARGCGGHCRWRIDRRAIIERAARGGQCPAGPSCRRVCRGTSRRRACEENVEEARRLLAEAGHPGGAGLGELLDPRQQGVRPRADGRDGPAAVGDRLGLAVRIEQVEWKVFLDMMKQRPVPGGPGRVVRRLRGPEHVSRPVRDRRRQQPDRLVEPVIRRPDRARCRPRSDFRPSGCGPSPGPRRSSSAKSPIIPIYFYTTVTLVRPGLEGVEPNLLNRIDFGQLRWAGGRRP